MQKVQSQNKQFCLTPNTEGYQPEAVFNAMCQDLDQANNGLETEGVNNVDFELADCTINIKIYYEAGSSTSKATVKYTVAEMTIRPNPNYDPDAGDNPGTNPTHIHGTTGPKKGFAFICPSESDYDNDEANNTMGTLSVADMIAELAKKIDREDLRKARKAQKLPPEDSPVFKTTFTMTCQVTGPDGKTHRSKKVSEGTVILNESAPGITTQR